jgi:hypothetical protein
MPSLKKREDFFHRGVAAYNQLVGPGEYYVCPLCTQRFTRADLEQRVLTLEHVPPKSAGGVSICLTCKRCNNTGGHEVDIALAELGQMQALQNAINGLGTFEGRAKFETGGVTLNARLSIRPGDFEVHLPKGINDPAIHCAQMRVFEDSVGQGGPGASFRLTGTFRIPGRALFVSVLRAAYLTAFAWFGYRYALDARLDIVRAQIQDPKHEHVPNCAFIFISSSAQGIDEPQLGVVSSPAEGVVVYFPAKFLGFTRPVCVVLPGLEGGQGFYAALSASRVETQDGQRVNLEARWLGWPLGPAHCLDFA